MKRYLLLTIGVLLVAAGYSQSSSNTLLPRSTFDFMGKNYTMKVEQNGEKEFVVELGTGIENDEPKSFRLFPIAMQSFVNGFVEHFSQLVSNEQQAKTGFDKKVKDKAREMFYVAVQAVYVIEETGPLAGELTLSEVVCVEEDCRKSEENQQYLRRMHKELFDRKREVEKALMKNEEIGGTRGQNALTSLKSIHTGDPVQKVRGSLSDIENEFLGDFNDFRKDSARLSKVEEDMEQVQNRLKQLRNSNFQAYESLSYLYWVAEGEFYQESWDMKQRPKVFTALRPIQVYGLGKKRLADLSKELKSLIGDSDFTGKTSELKNFKTEIEGLSKEWPVESVQRRQIQLIDSIYDETIGLKFNYPNEEVLHEGVIEQLEDWELCFDTLIHGLKYNMKEASTGRDIYKKVHETKSIVIQMVQSPQFQSICQEVNEIKDATQLDPVFRNLPSSLKADVSSELDEVCKELHTGRMTLHVEKALSLVKASKKNTELEGGTVRKGHRVLRNRLQALQSLIETGGAGECISMQVEDVQIEFQDGYLENIRVLGRIKLGTDSTIKVFENLFPIGFSSEDDLERLPNTYLYSIQDTTCRFRVRLGRNLLFYKPHHSNNRRDYSPRNVTRVFLPPLKDEPIYKSPTREIIEGKVFSDFAGINEDNPNGLVQIEIGKRFNVYTTRHKTKRDRGRGLNIGLLHYIHPRLMIAKIEENKRFLPLQSYDQIINGQLYATKYASTIDLFNYRNLEIGVDVNAFIFDSPNAKSSVHLNVGLHTSLTPLMDTLGTLTDGLEVTRLPNPREDFTLNFNPRVELLVHLLQEERYGATFNISGNYLYMVSNVTEARSEPLMQVGDPEIYRQKKISFERENSRDRFFWTLGMKELYYRPSEDNKGKLFFRYQFHFTQRFFNESFHQVQLGYSYYLLTSRKK